MKAKTRTRAFRVSPEIDKKIDEKTKKAGYMRPSDYLRELVRKDLMEA